MDKLRVGEDYDATVTFLGESAGYRNVLGVYKIAADGTIFDTQVLFANASLKNSGGDLIGGESSVDLSLNAGERLGFFVVPNGYSQSGMANLLNNDEASYKFVDASGDPANANVDGAVTLVHVDADGKETDVRSQYGTDVYHSLQNLNADGISHVVADVDIQNGTLKVGFEDLRGGGDRDYDDSVFSVDIGVTNAALLPREASGVSESVSTDDDTIVGGEGNDELFGMRGNDNVAGNEGDDEIWGNSGDDVLSGGEGNDLVRGGSGDDIMSGDKGNDDLAGNSGNDKIDGGEGNDTIQGNSGDDVIADGSGNDRTEGGSGDDTFIAGAGDDYHNGGSGFDTIDYSSAEGPIKLDLSKHTVEGAGSDELWGIERIVGTDFDDTMKGDKRDNVLEGGEGDDHMRGLGGVDQMSGGAGADTFEWLTKDVVRGEDHQGVDVITDFSVADGDVLDLSDMIVGQPDNIEEHLRLTENEDGTRVAVKVGEQFVDVVQLDGVFDQNVQSLVQDDAVLI